MRLLFATSIKFPSPLANRMQATEMANAFYDLLGVEYFYFGGRNLSEDMLPRDVQLIRIAGRKKSFLFAYKYLREVKKNNISHVYCREEKMLFFLLLFNRLYFKLPVKMVFELHFIPKHFSFQWRYLLKKVNSIVVTSSVIKSALVKFKEEKQIEVFPHGVDLKQFDFEMEKGAARESLNLPTEPYILGYTGSLRTMGNVKKGMDTVLEALVSLKDVCLIAVGGSSLDIEKYKRRAKGLGIAERVFFFERVNREELARYQKAVDALLLPMPANEYASMLPLKVFEYMASNRPIIASRLPSVLDVLNNENNFFVSPGSTEELVKMIEHVKVHEEEALSRAKKAHEDILACTWENRAKQIIGMMGKLK